MEEKVKLRISNPSEKIGTRYVIGCDKSEGDDYSAMKLEDF